MNKPQRIPVIKIGYDEYVAPDCTTETLIFVLESLIQTKATYIDHNYIYDYKKEQPNIQISLILSDQFREVTPEELENKKIEDLEESLKYAKQEKERIIKEKTCLENELKALKGEEQEPQKEEIL